MKARVVSIGTSTRFSPSKFAVGDIVQVVKSREYGFDFRTEVYGDCLEHTGLWLNCAHLSGGEWAVVGRTEGNKQDMKTELIERVRAVNAEAAEWLESGEAEALPGYSAKSDSTRLLPLFNWGSTPQGHRYWASIARALGEFDRGY